MTVFSVAFSMSSGFSLLEAAASFESSSSFLLSSSSANLASSMYGGGVMGKGGGGEFPASEVSYSAPKDIFSSNESSSMISGTLSYTLPESSSSLCLGSELRMFS